MWTDTRNGNNDIFGYDLKTEREFPIATGSAHEQHASVSGSIVVWDTCQDSACDIYGYDLTTGARFNTASGVQQLPQISGPQFKVSTARGVRQFPQISGKVVVWQDNRNGNWDIYGYNFSTQTEFQITTDEADQMGPRISGDIVIWSDRRNDHYTPSLCPGPRCDRDPDAIRFYGYDLSSMTEFPLPFPVWVIDGDLAAGTAAGTKDTPMGDRITAINIRSLQQVASWLVPRDATGIAISGNIIVWADNREGGSDSVYGYDLRTQTEFLVAMGGNVRNPAVYGDFVVWQDHREGDDFDIYGERILDDER